MQQSYKTLIGMNATEISNIWSAYQKQSLELRFLEYFHATTEDPDARRIVERMVLHTQKSLDKLTEFFLKEELTVPIGFTEEDRRMDTGKTFSDAFILFFCHDLTMLSLITYTSALSDCTRKDVRDFFQKNIDFTMDLQNDLTELMLSNGIYTKPPQVPLNTEITIANSVNYLNGLLKGARPINAAEIANLTRVIHRAQFSKMIFVAFNRLAKNKDVKKHFRKGRDAAEKVLDSLQEVMSDENIPLSASGELIVFDTEESPFSDKLMMYFVNACLGMFCFIMINQAMTSSLRSDIVYKLNKISKDMKVFYGQGLILTISEKWLEQPPQAVDHKV